MVSDLRSTYFTEANHRRHIQEFKHNPPFQDILIIDMSDLFHATDFYPFE